jgi:hypothetical protein
MRPAHAWAESEPIQKVVHHWTFERQYEAFVLAVRLQKDTLSRLMSERAKLPRPAVLGKFAERDRWIRERYVQRSSRDQRYSVSRFCMDLDLGRIEVPPTSWVSCGAKATNFSAKSGSGKSSRIGEFLPKSALTCRTSSAEPFPDKPSSALHFFVIAREKSSNCSRLRLETPGKSVVL